MLAHVGGTVYTLATLLLITRKDGQVFGFTDHDSPIVFNGVTYQTANSYTASAIAMSSDMSTSNMEVAALLDNVVITQADLEAGLWDFAQVLISLVNYNDLTMGAVPLMGGNLGQAVLTNGQYKAELRSLSQLVQQQSGDLYSPTCRATFGDSKCTMALGPLTFTGSVQSLNNVASWSDSTLTQAGPTVGYTDSKGRLVPTHSPYQVQVVPPTGGAFVANTSVIDSTGHTMTQVAYGHETAGAYSVQAGGLYTFDVSAAGGEVFINYTYSIGYFAYGTVKFTGGLNTGYSFKVKSFAPGLVNLALPPGFPIAVGDTYTITAGCDKQFGTCRDRWNNVIHFRGEPYIPGQDTILRPQTS
jgi:hypothetical protein